MITHERCITDDVCNTILLLLQLLISPAVYGFLSSVSASAVGGPPTSPVVDETTQLAGATPYSNARVSAAQQVCSAFAGRPTATNQRRLKPSHVTLPARWRMFAQLRWDRELSDCQCQPFRRWLPIFTARPHSLLCSAERCTSYSKSVCPSVRLSQAGTVSKRLMLQSCGLHRYRDHIGWNTSKIMFMAA